IQAIKSLRRSGKFIGGGGFEAPTTEINQRPSMVRQEITIQGLTGITAYDGKTGWKIRPWGGKKDAETLSEDEMKGIIDDADFDGPLVNYQEKGNKIEYVGTDQAEGTDTYKLKVTLANGETRYYYMDTDYYVPIKIEVKRTVRGAEQEYEQYPGDYKEVNGVYLPFSMESGGKGSSAADRGKVSYENIEANVALSDTLYAMPKITPKPSSK
ncbi:MAG TPA: hypothetical protein VL633_05110, partial [Bacteroidota bacterium]|nr:hypothetical protein [Bacteroidota bacterium]